MSEIFIGERRFPYFLKQLCFAYYSPLKNFCFAFSSFLSLSVSLVPRKTHTKQGSSLFAGREITYGRKKREIIWYDEMQGKTIKGEYGEWKRRKRENEEEELKMHTIKKNKRKKDFFYKRKNQGWIFIREEPGVKKIRQGKKKVLFDR